MYDSPHLLSLKCIQQTIDIGHRKFFKILRPQDLPGTAWVRNCDHICPRLDLSPSKRDQLICDKLHIFMSLFVAFTKLFIKDHWLHHRTCCTDRARQVSHDRNILGLRFQDTNGIRHHFSPSFCHIHRGQLPVICHRINDVSCHMRLVDISPKIYAGAHLFCFYCHAERHAIIFETSFFIHSLRQIRHFPCIPMSIGEINIHGIHQVRCHHVHHSSRTDTGRTVCFLPVKY